MKFYKNYLLISLIVSCFVISSCDDDDDDTIVNTYNYPEATLTVEGFDFSLGNKGDFINSDGLTVAFAPNGTNPNYEDNSHVWWNNRDVDKDNGQLQTKDMGNVDISTVNNAPTTWDMGLNINPLIVGHTIVAMCLDGYVKFQVISVAISGNYPAHVKYYYSQTANFDH